MALFDSHRPSMNTLVLLCLLSVGMILLDRVGNQWVGKLDSHLGTITDSIIQAGYAPIGWYRNLRQTLSTQQQLSAELETLREENLLLKGQMQRYFALKSELNQLKDLLDGYPTPVPGVLLARKVGQPATAFEARFTINRGLNDDVRPGDPVIDAYGVIGQVERATRNGATVIMLTSRDHALSVRLSTTGATAIAQGQGVNEPLFLERIPERFNLGEGDLLTTSGLDGVFEPGQPVARITEVLPDSGQGFVNLYAEPLARTKQIDYVLVLTQAPDEHRSTSDEPRLEQIAPHLPAEIRRPSDQEGSP